MTSGGRCSAIPANVTGRASRITRRLKRYLWCQIDPDSTHKQGMRFEGGFRIFDAPDPWGPWTTVFSVEHWDVGPGETSSFPTKWMSDDGRTIYLAFSGDDHFSVRKATLHTVTE